MIPINYSVSISRVLLRTGLLIVPGWDVKLVQKLAQGPCGEDIIGL
jgi:hypothetical protein